MAVRIKKVVEKETRDIHLQIKAIYDENDNVHASQSDIIDLDPPQPDITDLGLSRLEEVPESESAGGTKEVIYKMADSRTTPGMIDEMSPISSHIEEIIVAANLNPCYNYTFKYNGRIFDPNAKAVVMHVNDGDQIEIVQI